MELREWQYINKPASNSTTASTSYNTGNKSFKKRFDKIIKYYGDHLPAEVDYVLVNLLTNGSLNFTENYDNGDKVQYDIFIDDFDTEDWGIKIKVNGQPTEKYFDKGWAKLLNTLGAYIELPQMGDPEYKNLLVEWVAMNNKTSSSSGYKKRFEKLIKYHIDHASSELESITRKDISNWYFRLIEHYNTGSQEFDRNIIVSVDKATDTFYLNIFVDGKQVYHNDYKSYEEVLEILTDTYMFLPDAGTPEYDDLLTESLNEWKYANPPKASQPASTTSTKTNKEKFTELVAYMQKHRDSSTIFTSVNGPNDTGFEYEEQRAPIGVKEYNLSVEVSLGKHDLFTIHVDKDGKRIESIMAKGWEEFLRYLKIYFNVPSLGSPEYISLTESLTEWKLMNPPQPTTSKNPYTRGQAYRYNRLLDQITSDGIAKYKLHKITNITLDITVDTKKTKDLNIKITYDPADDDYELIINGRTSLSGCDYEKEILPLLQAGGVIANTNLCESAGSIADDFKLYENLWD